MHALQLPDEISREYDAQEHRNTPRGRIPPSPQDTGHHFIPGKNPRVGRLSKQDPESAMEMKGEQPEEKETKWKLAVGRICERLGDSKSRGANGVCRQLN